MANENAFMDVFTRMLKRQLVTHPVKTGGVLIYGNLEPKKWVAIANRAFYLFAAFVIIMNIIDGYTTGNYLILGLAAIATFVVTRGWFNIKIRSQRLLEADEMLSIWLLTHFPNEVISSKDLLQGMTKSSAERVFILEITSEASIVYVYDATFVVSEEMSEFEPIEVHVVEKKTV